MLKQKGGRRARCFFFKCGPISRRCTVNVKARARGREGAVANGAPRERPMATTVIIYIHAGPTDKRTVLPAAEEPASSTSIPIWLRPGNEAAYTTRVEGSSVSSDMHGCASARRGQGARACEGERVRGRGREGEQGEGARVRARVRREGERARGRGREAMGGLMGGRRCVVGTGTRPHLKPSARQQHSNPRRRQWPRAAWARGMLRSETHEGTTHEGGMAGWGMAAASKPKPYRPLFNECPDRSSHHRCRCACVYWLAAPICPVL